MKWASGANGAPAHAQVKPAASHVVKKQGPGRSYRIPLQWEARALRLLKRGNALSKKDVSWQYIYLYILKILSLIT